MRQGRTTQPDVIPDVGGISSEFFQGSAFNCRGLLNVRKPGSSTRDLGFSSHPKDYKTLSPPPSDSGEMGGWRGSWLTGL